MVEVATRAGRVSGRTVTAAGRGDASVRAFLGIPYARAARFGPPAAVPAWDGVRDATAFGPAAPQPVGGPLDGLVPGSFRGETDEDACLTLNVWAPAGGTGSRAAPSPVLVWFPGGAFTIGAASQPVYDGARLCAEQGVVVVTGNYRLGALGFLDARPLGGVANCGLRDAIAALEWVRDNIAEFGGDPARVCAFGESAGGGIVLHLCASPPAAGLFQRAIVQSGATFNTLDETRAATVRDTLVDTLGLAGDRGGLASVPVDALLDAQSASAIALLPSIGMMPFHPMVDGDLLEQPPREALASGAAAGVPLIVGTTTDEMRLFLDLTGPPPPRPKLCSRVARYTHADADRADAIVAAYEDALETTDTNEIWATLFGDVEMERPAAAVRDAHAPHGPTFAYRFGWPAVDPRLGACHGIDIPFTFGNFVDGWGEFAGADHDARELSRTIRDAWAAFARTGDPGWPQPPGLMRFERAAHAVDADPVAARLTALP